MSAVILSLDAARAARAADVDFAPATTGSRSRAARDHTARFHFWTGTSGRRYVHTIYSVFDCPPLEAANYILAKRNGTAQRDVLEVGRFANSQPMRNLTALRQQAMELGADEVHVHLLAMSADDAEAIEADLNGAPLSAHVN